MQKHPDSKPRQFHGVMVSSTFTDLEQHRTALMDALQKQKLVPIGMEHYVPKPDDDVISSSLGMVREGKAYIGLISHRCGQVVTCPERNPQSYSVTRLEFEEAQRLGLPTLVFVMGENHLVKKADVEIDRAKIRKLDAFRARAKEGRIYVVFESLEDFTSKAIHAVAELRQYLDHRESQPALSEQSPIEPTKVALLAALDAVRSLPSQLPLPARLQTTDQVQSLSADDVKAIDHSISLISQYNELPKGVGSAGHRQRFYETHLLRDALTRAVEILQKECN